MRHAISVDGAGDMTLAELEQSGGEDFDFDDAWRAIRPDDALTLIYIRHHRSPQRRRAHPRQSSPSSAPSTPCCRPRRAAA